MTDCNELLCLCSRMSTNHHQLITDCHVSLLIYSLSTLATPMTCRYFTLKLHMWYCDIAHTQCTGDVLYCKLHNSYYVLPFSLDVNLYEKIYVWHTAGTVYHTRPYTDVVLWRRTTYDPRSAVYHMRPYTDVVLWRRAMYDLRSAVYHTRPYTDVVLWRRTMYDPCNAVYHTRLYTDVVLWRRMTRAVQCTTRDCTHCTVTTYDPCSAVYHMRPYTDFVLWRRTMYDPRSAVYHMRPHTDVVLWHTTYDLRSAVYHTRPYTDVVLWRRTTYDPHSIAHDYTDVILYTYIAQLSNYNKCLWQRVCGPVL